MKIHDSTLFLFLRPSAVIRNEMGFFKERTFQQQQQQQQQQKGRKTIISLGFECIERRQRPRVSGSVHCFFFSSVDLFDWQDRRGAAGGPVADRLRGLEGPRGARRRLYAFRLLPRLTRCRVGRVFLPVTV